MRGWSSIERPGEGLAERVLVGAHGDGRGDVLGLATIAVWWHDELTGHEVGDVGPVVLPDDVEPQVDARRRAGGGEDAVVVHVEDGWVELDLGEALCELLGVAPVCGRTAAVEEPGGSEGKGAGAERDDASTAVVGRTEFPGHGHGRRVSAPPPQE